MKHSKSVMAVALAVFTVHSLPVAVAQEGGQAQPPKRFSWDQRPGKCFAPDVPQGSPMCAERPNWPNFADTVSRVQLLFAQGDFDLIARAERELASSDQRFSVSNPTYSTGEYYFDAWYWALNVMFKGDPTRYADTLAKWKAATGDAGYVVLAEALAREGEGWEARGTGYASTVSKEAWTIYHRKLQEAESLLDAADPTVKSAGSWHAEKLRLAYQLNAEKGTEAPEFRKAVSAWPYYKRLYMTAINYSMPEWGGSFEDVEAIARYAYDKTGTTDGAAWYAVLYTETFASNSKYVLRDTQVDWPLMKRGFRDALNTKIFGDRLLFSFARTACQMKDRAEAKRLYELIDALPEAPRPKNATTDACRIFANETPKGGAMLESGANRQRS